MAGVCEMESGGGGAGARLGLTLDDGSGGEITGRVVADFRDLVLDRR